MLILLPPNILRNVKMFTIWIIDDSNSPGFCMLFNLPSPELLTHEPPLISPLLTNVKFRKPISNACLDHQLNPWMDSASNLLLLLLSLLFDYMDHSVPFVVPIVQVIVVFAHPAAVATILVTIFQTVHCRIC